MDRRRWTSGNATRQPSARHRLFVGVVLVAVTALAGCRSNNKTALIEAELRTREREVRNLRSELDRAETFNSALQYDLLSRPDTCAVAPAPAGTIVDSPQAVMSGMVKNVVLGRGTGGVDDDRLPGDEALQVVIVPQDGDGSAVKVPGAAVVLAYQVTAEGLKVPLSRWEVPALQLQRSWRSGLFATGYYVTLPWKNWPAAEKLRVVVQFHTLPNNRPFEAERDVTVRPMIAGPVRGVVPPVAEPVVPPAPDAEKLPPPLDGPILTPGAWFRERAAGLGVVEAAKPGPMRQPARLLAPQIRSDDAPPERP